MYEISSIRKDYRLSLLPIVFFVVSALNSTIKNVLPVPAFLWMPVSVVCGCVFLWFFLRAIKIILCRRGNVFLMTLFLFVLLYGISLLRNQIDVSYIVDYAFWTFVFCMPLGLAVFSINNYEILYGNLLRYSYLISGILSCIVFFPKEDETYNMFFSSSLILPLLLHLNEYLEGRKRRFLILSCCEFVVILLYGSRGALLCLAVFVVLYFFLSIRSLQVKCVYLVVALGLTVFLLHYKNQIGDGILNFLASQGYHSRTLTLMFSDEMMHLSDRDVVWSKCKEMINEKPLIGWGVGGELGYLSRSLGNTEGRSTPHNGFLELMLHHGVIVGMCVGLFFVFSIFRVVVVHDVFLKKLMMIFYASFMTITMSVGDGYLIKPGVWMYLFLFFASFKRVGI